MLTTNQVLHKGRYRIINAFGQDETGGMYEAYDTVSNTNVVLKESVGKLGKVATSGQLEAINAAFLGGAKVLTEIKHDSIVSVQDYFSEIDRQYLVLESVAGFDLTKFLQPDERRPALTDVLSWADQLLNALNYLHTLPAPIFHRDIRPDNVKLTSSFKVKLLTAGIATNVDPDVITPIPNQASENTALHYRPLEQLWGGLDPTSQKVILNSYDEKSERMLMQPLDARSDLYSLGATLYHVLTGSRPSDALERSIATLEEKPDPLQKPSEVDDNIPPEISDVIMKAMAVRREDRYDSAMILRQVLRTAVVRVKERKAEEAEAAKQNRSTPTEVPAELKTERPPEKNVESTPEPPAAQMESPAPQTEIESIEAQLERERLKAEERQRELEAEQGRLEEERRRIEQKRLELEAEKERQRAEKERLEREAEAARQKAEEERLAFEAEQERKRLEKERLEQEAEKERQRAAQRLAELEAAQAQQRAEEERLVLEAEEERKRAEERLRELEAEQERKRLEKERLEQEAEEERQRAAQKLAELEAEQERKRAEQEHLELEAEEERRRAEQRLQELKSEQERYRAEHERIKAEAEEERKRAQQRLEELSTFDLDDATEQNSFVSDQDESDVEAADDDADQVLLELEPGQTSAEASVDSFELLDNELFEEESDEEPVPDSEFEAADVSAEADVSTSVQAYESTYESSFSDYQESGSFNWRLPAIAGAAVLLLIVLVGAWSFISSDSTETKPPASKEETTVSPDQGIQTSSPDNQSTANPVQSFDSTPSTEPAQSTTTEPDGRVSDRARQLQLNAAQEKSKKQAAPAKTPPPKKAVTVDDLINDN